MNESTSTASAFSASENTENSFENNRSNQERINRKVQRGKILTSEEIDFLSPNELTQSLNLQRELRKLRFENPGEAMLDEEKNRHNLHRPKRRVAAKISTQKDYKPFHDRHGYFVTSTGRTLDLCDCLSEKCSGCHRPCRKCSSQKCSFQCRSNRSAIVEEVEIQGVGKTVMNTFLK